MCKCKLALPPCPEAPCCPEAGSECQININHPCGLTNHQRDFLTPPKQSIRATSTDQSAGGFKFENPDACDHIFVQEDGVNTADWLKALSTFTAGACRRFSHHINIHVLCQVCNSKIQHFELIEARMCTLLYELCARTSAETLTSQVRSRICLFLGTPSQMFLHGSCTRMGLIGARTCSMW